MFLNRLKLSASLSQHDISVLGNALSDMSTSHSAMLEESQESTSWDLHWITEEKNHPSDLTARLVLKAELEDISALDVSNDDWEIEEMPEKNWLAESYKKFKPFSVGPFFIYGSHYEGAYPEGQMGLQIDAATAFGSGEHGTTKGCLQAMIELKDQGLCPWNVLDMGCGSGILAIAAWKLWKSPVLAVDNDEEAIHVTSRYCQANDIKAGGTTITCEQGDGFKAAIVKERGPFDLIVANILAGTLTEMAGDLKNVLDENGIVILSGMLNEQADNVLKTYEDLGLRLKQRIDLGEWSSLVLQYTAAQDNQI